MIKCLSPYNSIFLWCGLSWTLKRLVERFQSESALWKQVIEEAGTRQLHECFIISNVGFPEVLSKVSELHKPSSKRSTPLWPLGAKQLSTFLFSLSNESLCMDYLFEHSGAFYVTRFSLACLKASGFAAWEGRLIWLKWSNVFGTLNRQSVTNIFLGDTAIENMFKWECFGDGLITFFWLRRISLELKSYPPIKSNLIWNSTVANSVWIIQCGCGTTCQCLYLWLLRSMSAAQ